MPITRAYLASYYDRYPFTALSDDVSRLSSEIRSMVNDLLNQHPPTEGFVIFIFIFIFYNVFASSLPLCQNSSFVRAVGSIVASYYISSTCLVCFQGRFLRLSENIRSSHCWKLAGKLRYSEILDILVHSR